MVASADMVGLKAEGAYLSRRTYVLARIEKDSVSRAPKSSLTARAGIEILYFKSPAFALSKITGASSKNLLASNTHALPLRLQVFRAQLASQELVAIMEKIRRA